jgi:O-antigen ligase
LKAGLKIIGDYPLFGTGPDTVDVVFKQPRYGLSETAKRNVHLHNNLIQIGAERGLPALAAWLAFLVWAAAALVGEIRRKNPMTLAAAAAGLAALLASFAAGLFEYNFGDSEVNSLLLYLITMPLAMSRAARGGPGAGGDGLSG